MICVFKCPFCGDEMKYDASEHLLKCVSCDNTLKVEEFDYSLMSFDNKTIISKDLSGFSCPNCGAEMIVGKIQTNVTCPYCNKSMAVFGLSENELEPEYIIPFNLDKDEAMRKLVTWWSGKESMPKLDVDKLQLTLTETYVPVWLYDSEVYVGMNATVAPFEMSVKSVTSQSDKYEITKNVYSSFSKVPIVASAKTNSKIFHEIEPYNYEGLEKFNPGYLSGHLAERYYLSCEDSMPRLVSQLQKYGKEQCKLSIETDKVGGTIINSHATELEIIPGLVTYALVPVWICNYMYKGANQQVFINGQTGKVYGDVIAASVKFKLEVSAFAISSLLACTGIVFYIWDRIFGSDIYSLASWLFLIVPIILACITNKAGKNTYKTQSGEYFSVKSDVNINSEIQYKQGGKFSVIYRIVIRIAIGLMFGLLWGYVYIPVFNFGKTTAVDAVAVLVAIILASVDSFIFARKRLAYFKRNDTVDYFEYVKAGKTIEEPAKIIKVL